MLSDIAKYIAYAKTVSVHIITVSLLMLVISPGCREQQLLPVAKQVDLASQITIRVLLGDDIKSCKIMAPSFFRVVDNQTSITETWIEKPDTDIQVTIISGKIHLAGRTFPNQLLRIEPNRSSEFTFNGSRYRGNLVLSVNSGGFTFDAINFIPVESYLKGVVGAEMPSYWEPQALQAQAVAARTYCRYIKKRFGLKRQWDVKATQASQVYKGISSETRSVIDAVDKTAGRVLLYRTLNGRTDIFPTYYGSNCAGHTENSKNVFGDFFPPLVGVSCGYCRRISRPKNFFWDMVKFNKADASKKLLKRYPNLKKLGKIKNIEPTAKSSYDGFERITSIKLTGENGKTDSLKGEDFRLTIDPSGRKIKSSSYKIIQSRDTYGFLSGRGYGHAVGMCQSGAQGMARKGKTAKQILSHYYPNSILERRY